MPSDATVMSRTRVLREKNPEMFINSPQPPETRTLRAVRLEAPPRVASASRLAHGTIPFTIDGVRHPDDLDPRRLLEASCIWQPRYRGNDPVDRRLCVPTFRWVCP